MGDKPFLSIKEFTLNPPVVMPLTGSLLNINSNGSI
jgi:hypothetical protein